jgi:hypothetical protein
MAKCSRAVWKWVDIPLSTHKPSEKASLHANMLENSLNITFLPPFSL